MLLLASCAPAEEDGTLVVAGGSNDGEGGSGGSGPAPSGDGGPAQAAADGGGPPPAFVPEYGVCSADGWCWDLPYPQGHDVLAAWGSTGDDVWLVGEEGLLVHYDGEGFRGHDALGAATLRAVHGTGSGDVWAVGDGGVVLHYDGSSWERRDLAELAGMGDAGGTGELRGVWAASRNAVWIVGHSGVAAVVAVWNGTGWTSHTGALGSDRVLRAVLAAGPDEAWIVGDGGYVVQFNAGVWTEHVSGTSSNLYSVHALARDDIWAAGDAGTAVHYDGTLWTLENAGLDGNLRAVRVDEAVAPALPMLDASVIDPGGGATDAGTDSGLPAVPEGPWLAWAIGEGGRVFRRNADGWVAVPSGTGRNLNAALRIRKGELLTAGDDGLVMRWSGDSRESLSYGSARNRLALWGGGGTLWTVGDEILRRDEAGWLGIESPTDRSLFGVYGAGKDLWVVGTAGTIVHYDGANWSAVMPNVASDRWLRGIWEAGGTTWIVGQDGLMVKGSADGTWQQYESGVLVDLSDTWGFADDDFWAVGDAGTLLHWDGQSWAAVTLGGGAAITASLRAVWGSEDYDVWAVGTLGTALHWDGIVWSDRSTGGRYTLNDVWVSPEGNVYAVGTSGTIAVYDGFGWTEQKSGTNRSLESVWGSADGTVWAAGIGGTVLVRRTR